MLLVTRTGLLLLASFPEPYLLTLPRYSSAPGLRFLRVQFRHVAGQEAARSELLCGRTPGIGESTTNGLPSGHTGKIVSCASSASESDVSPARRPPGVGCFAAAHPA